MFLFCRIKVSLRPPGTDFLLTSVCVSLLIIIETTAGGLTIAADKITMDVTRPEVVNEEHRDGVASLADVMARTSHQS